jgi:hypothetical protein
MLDETSSDDQPESAEPNPTGPNPTGPDLASPESAHFQMPPVAGETDKAAGWEEVAEGRFMPRRVRGSCHGRALG